MYLMAKSSRGGRTAPARRHRSDAGDGDWRELADRFSTMIRNGEFGVGDVLPPERTLAVRLGTSRGMVRRALSHLESRGFIDCRQGSGRRILRTGPVTTSSLVSRTIGHPE